MLTNPGAGLRGGVAAANARGHATRLAKIIERIKLMENLLAG
jgi:hypothetical protein